MIGSNVIDEQGEVWTLESVKNDWYCLLNNDTRQRTHVTLDRYDQLVQITEAN